MENNAHFLKFLIVLFTVTHLASCKTGSNTYKNNRNTTLNDSYSKINIKADAVKNGVFDISVEYGPDGIGWMAYSRVSLPKYVETKIAKSTDRGKTWKYITTVNHSKKGFIHIGKSQTQGVWRYETPSLLYDVKDKQSRRWKLFTQKYLSKPPYKKGNSLFQHGWIEYKYAKTPAGPWSKPIRLFGSKKNKSKINPNMLNPGLRKNLFYNEIGTIAVDGEIYLSVDASTTPTGIGKWNERKIVLFSSKNHGESWKYVGTLTDSDDAGEFGYLIFTGSSLVKEGKHLYLLASPAGKKGLFVKNRSHDGAYAIEFSDISKAKLKRDKKGTLIVSKIFKINSNMHSGGLADYDEQNTHGGVLFSQLSTNNKDKPEFFQVFSSNESIR